MKKAHADIVVFGATGYTGSLVAQALVERGMRPVLAGRSHRKLADSSARLGGLETRVADASDQASMRGLVERGDVLISTVGPFDRWGRTAIDAALHVGAHYVDCSGEPLFIQTVLNSHERAVAAGSTLLPAFGYDYVPGTLAAALALRHAAAHEAVRLDIGYFVTGSVRRGLSSGTIASTAATLPEPVLVRHAGELVPVRAAARVRQFNVAGRRRSAILAAGSEVFTLPPLFTNLTDIEVYNGWFPRLARAAQLLSGAVAGVEQLPRGEHVVRRLLSSRTSSGGGPDAEARGSTRSHVVAVAYDAAGNAVGESHVEGPSIYDLTAALIAWGSAQLAAGNLPTGALGPLQAFGIDRLVAGAAELGLVEVTRSHAQTPKEQP